MTYSVPMVVPVASVATNQAWGDRVLYPDVNASVYESTIDANVWSPVAYPVGWQLLE